MSALLDSSVLVAALAADELKHAECLALLLKGGNCIYSHALLETFSTLTGGKLGVRVTADFAVRMTVTRTGASSMGKNQSVRGEFRLMAAPL